MKYIFILYIVVVVLFIVNYFKKKWKLEELKKTLNKNWGNTKINEYYNFDLIGRYFYNAVTDKSNFYQIISDKTSDDLDFHALFKYIDRTASKIGQQYLYFKLRTLSLGTEELKKFDTLVELIKNDSQIRLFCQLEFSKLNSNNAYYIEELIHGQQIKKPKWLPLVYALSIGAILGIFLSFIYPAIIFILIPIYITNLVIHYGNKKNINYSLVAISEFLKSIHVAKKISKIPSIKGHFGDFSFLSKIPKLKRKTQFINFEKRIDSDITAILSFFAELVKIMFNIEVLTYFSFINSLTKEKKNIAYLFKYLGEIDSAISVASLRQGIYQYCRPSFVNDKKAHYDNISHPLIVDCISNNLDLDNQSVLLTGSNMSGKTTFIRTIAINTIMAQTLYTCFAKEYTAPFFRIYTSIRISDELLEGKSYYLQEVLTIKEFIDESDKSGNCLFILDEIFKGTNTLERISGGKAILSYLNKNRHIVFVSTHDIELTELLEKENYSLYHFEEHVENNELTFDYTLKKGALKSRNAIKILELYEYPSKIISDANETISHIS